MDARPSKAFDQDLRRRAVAQKTRRAYAIDTAQFAAWASAQGARPRDGRPPRSAPLPGRAVGAGQRADARSRASSPRCGPAARARSSSGSVTRIRRSCCSSPKRPQRLPRVLRLDEVAALLDRIPAGCAARAPRPGAVRAGLRVGAARRGAGVARRSSRSTSTPRRSGSRARAARRGSCPSASTRGARSRRYLQRGRPPPRHRRRAPRCCCPNPAAGCRPPTSGGGCGCGRGKAAARSPGADRRPSARPAPLLRHPSARGRRRPAGDSGTAWPRKHLDDPGLHSGRVGPLENRLRPRSSSGITRASWGITLETQRKSDRASRPLEAVQGDGR